MIDLQALTSGRVTSHQGYIALGYIGGLLGLWYLISRHAVTFRDLLGPFLFLAFACWSPRWLGTPATETSMREYLGLICLVLVFLAVCGPGQGLRPGSAAPLRRAGRSLVLLYPRWPCASVTAAAKTF